MVLLVHSTPLSRAQVQFSVRSWSGSLSSMESISSGGRVDTWVWESLCHWRSSCGPVDSCGKSVVLVCSVAAFEMLSPCESSHSIVPMPSHGHTSITSRPTTREKVHFTSSVSAHRTVIYNSFKLECWHFLIDFFSDACYQALAYWTMCVCSLMLSCVSHPWSTHLSSRSALTNDPFTLARFAGFYKAVQSAVSKSIHSRSAV